MNRRKFLKSMSFTGGMILLPGSTGMAESVGQDEFNGILIDTTRCLGCRTCEESCAEAHGLPMPDIYDENVFEEQRTSSTSQWTVVNRFDSAEGEVFVKKQCMHCAQPACASACLTKAMLKTKEGPVIWRGDKCIGCRYCMISCPFDVPKFEYDKAAPTLQKCTQCWERLQEGQQPACVENCPGEALLFGKKRDLISIARTRISESPDLYENHLYGEHEVGGTGNLYLSSVPFEKLGFKSDLGSKPYPEYTAGFLYSVPFVLLLWPALLLGLSKAKQNEEKASEEE